MNKKQYTICRLSIIILLSLSIAISISLNNYYLPIILTITAFFIMSYIKKQLKTEDVLADERDYKIAGDSARYTIYIYAFIGVIGAFVLMAISQKEGLLYILSQYLAISVCFIMILNSIIFIPIFLVKT